MQGNGDYISREAVVSSLNRLCGRVCQYSKAQRNVMCGACPLGDAFMVIEDGIPAADVRPRWISVTERLPEPYVEVLLYSGEDRYTGYMHNDKRFTVNASHYPDRPTHWMPLPEPPKEG